MYPKVVKYDYRSKEKIQNSVISCRNNFIIIDNADTILYLQSNIKNFINLEQSNQYLIMSRNMKGLRIGIDSYCSIYKDSDGVYRLKELSELGKRIDLIVYTRWPHFNGFSLSNEISVCINDNRVFETYNDYELNAEDYFY